MTRELGEKKPQPPQKKKERRKKKVCFQKMDEGNQKEGLGGENNEFYEFKNKLTKSSWVTTTCAQKSALRIEVIYAIMIPITKATTKLMSHAQTLENLEPREI